MALVKAMATATRASVVSDGADTVIPFDGHDALGDGNGWIDVRPYTTLSVYVEAAGGSGCSFTVEGKHTADGTALDVFAKAAKTTGTYAVDGTAATGTLGNATHLAFIRVLEDGTSTETQTVEVVAK